MTEEAANQDQSGQAGLKDAPKPAPVSYSMKVYAKSREGYVVEISTFEDVRPVAWLVGVLAGLTAQQFSPVDPYAQPAPTVIAAAPATAAPATAAAAGGPVWIKGVNGAPPRCSIHGAGKYLEGIAKTGKNIGAAYAFWACSDRNCKPKGDPV